MTVHRISKIEIKNFRSCQSTKLFLEGFSPLVGYNNAGKSNVLKAVDALVKAKCLSKDEFNKIDSPLEITAVLSGLSEKVLSDLPSAQRSSLEPYLENEAVCIRFYQEEPKSAKSAISLGVKACSHPHDGWKDSSNVSKAVSALFPEPTFINSMEDAAEDVSKVKAGNTIGKLIVSLQKEILKTKGKEIETALSAIGKKLNVDGDERLSEFSDFDKSINRKIGDFFPGLELSVHIPTPNISDLFKKGTIRVAEKGGEEVSDFGSMGHGAQRAIQMTLIQHLAEITKDATKEGQTNLLLIDEPELFLHPQAIEQVRASLKILSRNGYQVIFSTHSPFMIEREDISITNIVRKGKGGTKVSLRLREAISKVIDDNESQARLLFDTYNLSQILFSDAVLVAEGDTEKCVLPELFRAISKRTMGESKVALVIAGGSPNIPGMLKILKEMCIPAKALVDLDFAFTLAQKFKFLDKNNKSIKACVKLMQNIQTEYGFKLQGGLPTKSTGFKACDIYEILAQQQEAEEYIENLHHELRAQSIWLWTLGAIEPHLCLDTKRTGEWFRFNQRLSTEPVESVLQDIGHITSFVEWCNDAKTN